MTLDRTRLGVIIASVALLFGTASAGRHAQSSIKFTDAHRQAAEFIHYENTIDLTPEQKETMNRALAAIPAPCCSAYSIATCCCPCNLAKSVWGLSKLLIAEHRSSAEQVRTTVTEWLRFTNASGYTGDACFTGGCNRSFERNGCGGMDHTHVAP